MGRVKVEVFGRRSGRRGYDHRCRVGHYGVVIGFGLFSERRLLWVLLKLTILKFVYHFLNYITSKISFFHFLFSIIRTSFNEFRREVVLNFTVTSLFMSEIFREIKNNVFFFSRCQTDILKKTFT